VYADVLNYGPISHTFDVLVPCCVHTHLNFKLVFIRHTHVYVEISDIGWRYLDGAQRMDVWCGYWLFSTWRLLWSWEARRTDECCLCCSLWLTHQTRHPFVEHCLSILTNVWYLIIHVNMSKIPNFTIIIIIIIIINDDVSCHRPFLPGTALEPAVIPTAQASSFILQYFPYYVWCSKYSCLL